MASVVTAAQLTDLLFKKNLGVPLTNSNNAYYSEPARPARSGVFQSQLYAEVIPSVAPADLVNATVDDLGASLTGSLAGKTSSVSKMIRKYVKVPLVTVVGSNDQAYECALDPTFGRVLQSSVPFNTDAAGSYVVRVYKHASSGSGEIPAGSGSWTVDSDAGILTFLTLSNISGVSAAAPPSISFYRYVGKFGASTAEQTVEAISNQEITFTQLETFNGKTGGTGDALAAIVVDNRDLSLLSSTTPAMALVLGAEDKNGSWRLVIYGGSNTSLRFQTRVGGVWVTKSAMMQF
jgi:hypothetical protein